MALAILYYGDDTSHRVSVLMSAGYAVENCKSASELISAIESTEETLAILFSDRDGDLPHDSLSAARARCAAPLILFRDSAGYDDASDFDFIIPNLTPPADWLQEIASQIEQHRRSSAQQLPKPAKVMPIDATPNKIKRMERESTAAKGPDLQRLGPPPDDRVSSTGDSAGPRYLI